MQSKMDQFKDFVRRHPSLRDEVRNNTRTWQNIYEEWTLYGEDDSQWSNYRTTEVNSENLLDGMNMDSIKNVITYIQKLNPDKIHKTLNSFQKIVQIAQSVGGNKKAPLNSGQMFNTMYNDWWD